MKKPDIIVDTEDTHNGFDEIGRNLIGYNSAAFGKMDIRPLLLTIRDGEGTLQAGLGGKIFYQWLTIDLLWVAEALRGRGIGTALLARAEAEARARGCADVWLDTIGTQSLAFYEKNGYAAWGELPNYPRGHKRTFFRKSLKAA
jgi:GNAT superfamily N-acetyltransferase